MKPWLQEMVDEELGMQIAPLIDMVFLLLIYFLVTSSLKPQESDIGIQMPGIPKESNSVIPEEVYITIDERGWINYGGVWYQNASDHDLKELTATLLDLRQVTKDPVVTIAANGESLHQRTIDVMNACAAAGIKNVTVSTQ